MVTKHVINQTRTKMFSREKTILLEVPFDVSANKRLVNRRNADSLCHVSTSIFRPVAVLLVRAVCPYLLILLYPIGYNKSIPNRVYFYTKIERKIMHYYKRIRELRETKGETQKEIATMLDMRQPHYTRYESGERDTPTEKLKALAIHYGVSTDYILELTDDPKPPKPSKA